jgi:histidyl-tRNA synthetase
MQTKKIPFVLIAGNEEIENQLFNLKNMTTGHQETVSKNQLIEKLYV